MKVHEDDEPKKDNTKIPHHLAEKKTKLAKIKSLRLIHRAAKNIRTIVQEVVGSLQNCPGAHSSRDSRLVGKLEVVEAEGVSEEVEDDPADLFPDQGGDTHAAISRVKAVSLFLMLLISFSALLINSTWHWDILERIAQPFEI